MVLNFCATISSDRIVFYRMESYGAGHLEMYARPRIRHLITVVIWFSFGYFFTWSSRAEVKKLCPGGKNSLLGGKQKRNIQTLEQDFRMLLCWCVFTVLDNCLVVFVQAYQHILGNYCVANVFCCKILSATGVHIMLGLEYSLMFIQDFTFYVVFPTSVLCRSRQDYFHLWTDRPPQVNHILE